MQTILSIKPLLAVLASLLAVPLILRTGDRPNLREFWSVLAGVIKFSIVISMVPAILSGHTIEYTLVSFYQGIDIKFRVDALGLLFATVSSFLWIVTTFYSIGYMRSGQGTCPDKILYLFCHQPVVHHRGGFFSQPDHPLCLL